MLVGWFVDVGLCGPMPVYVGLCMWACVCGLCDSLCMWAVWGPVYVGCVGACVCGSVYMGMCVWVCICGYVYVGLCMWAVWGPVYVGLCMWAGSGHV